MAGGLFELTELGEYAAGQGDVFRQQPVEPTILDFGFSILDCRSPD